MLLAADPDPWTARDVVAPEALANLTRDVKGPLVIHVGFDVLYRAAHITVPLEVRNQTARLQIQNEDSAGAVQLLDSGGIERRVGLVSAAATETSACTLKVRRPNAAISFSTAFASWARRR